MAWNRCALWLMPGGEPYQRLAQIIHRLSRRYCAPIFEPHITLLADIAGDEEAILSKCQTLAAILSPFTVQVTELDQLNEYYRCIFLRVLETHPIVEANSKARHVFEQDLEASYMPHLSLLYGDIDGMTKKQIVQNLAKSWDSVFSVNSFYLIDGRGGPTQWRKLKEFHFQHSSDQGEGC